MAIIMEGKYKLWFILDLSYIVSNKLRRDWLVGNITNSEIPSTNLTNGSFFNATTTFAGYTYETNIQYVSGLLQNTSMGINHNITVEVNGVVNATDGLVAVMQVFITGTPPKSYVHLVHLVCYPCLTIFFSFAWRPSPPQAWKLCPTFLLLFFTLVSLS